MTQKLFLAIVALVITTAAAAQSDTLKRWKKEYRTKFVEDCIGTARANLSADSAKYYCQCMAMKLENIYPNSDDVDKITQEDLQTPEFMAIIRECLKPAKWPENEQTSFITGCIKNATKLGEEKAKKYCQCMLEKVMMKYPTAKDADAITTETLAKPEWKRLIYSCLE